MLLPLLSTSVCLLPRPSSHFLAGETPLDQINFLDFPSPSYVRHFDLSSIPGPSFDVGLKSKKSNSLYASRLPKIRPHCTGLSPDFWEEG